MRNIFICSLRCSSTGGTFFSRDWPLVCVAHIELCLEQSFHILTALGPVMKCGGTGKDLVGFDPEPLHNFNTLKTRPDPFIIGKWLRGLRLIYG